MLSGLQVTQSRVEGHSSEALTQEPQTAHSSTPWVGPRQRAALNPPETDDPCENVFKDMKYDAPTCFHVLVYILFFKRGKMKLRAQIMHDVADYRDQHRTFNGETGSIRTLILFNRTL